MAKRMTTERLYEIAVEIERRNDANEKALEAIARGGHPLAARLIVAFDDNHIYAVMASATTIASGVLGRSHSVAPVVSSSEPKGCNMPTQLCGDSCHQLSGHDGGCCPSVGCDGACVDNVQDEQGDIRNGVPEVARARHVARLTGEWLADESSPVLDLAKYVVVIADPGLVRVIVPEIVGATDSITRAALLALRDGPSDTTRQLFGQHLANILTKVAP